MYEMRLVLSVIFDERTVPGYNRERFFMGNYRVQLSIEGLS